MGIVSSAFRKQFNLGGTVPELPDMPKFIEKIGKCPWCGEEVPLNTAYLNDRKDAVEAWYICENKKCKYLVKLGRPNRSGMKYTGGFIDTWKKAFEIRIPGEEEEEEIEIEHSCRDCDNCS